VGQDAGTLPRVELLRNGRCEGIEAEEGGEAGFLDLGLLDTSRQLVGEFFHRIKRGDLAEDIRAFLFQPIGKSLLVPVRESSSTRTFRSKDDIRRDWRTDHVMEQRPGVVHTRALRQDAGFGYGIGRQNLPYVVFGERIELVGDLVIRHLTGCDRTS